MVPYPMHPFLAIIPVLFTYCGECWITWWGVGLHSGEWGVTWWRVLAYIVKSVGLHGRVLSCMVDSDGLHRGIGYLFIFINIS